MCSSGWHCWAGSRPWPPEDARRSRPMEYRTLPGDSGIEVSAVGLGCLPVGLMAQPAEVVAVAGAALDADVTYFDTADIYGGPFGQGEELLGRALGTRKDDVVIATKFGAQHHHEG